MLMNNQTQKILLLSTTYSLFMAIYTCWRHELFLTRAYDLGIFTQAFWTTIYAGKFFYETPDLNISATGSFFGVHFSPLMFLILILFAIAPHPYTLLIFQSVILGFAAIPLFKLSYKILKDEKISTIFVVLYLLYPPIIYANIFDFHLESFFPLIFLCAFYYLENEEFVKFYVTLLLGLLILDFASSILVLSTVIYSSIVKYRQVIFRKRWDQKILRHLIFSTMMMAVAVFYFVLSIIALRFFGKIPFSGDSHWPDLGNTPFEIVIGLLDPSKVFRALSYDFGTKILNLALYLLPLIFLPLFAPLELLPGMPWLVMSLLSRYPPYYQIYWQYGAIMSPFLFYSALHGLRRITNLRRKNVFSEIKIVQSVYFKLIRQKKIVLIVFVLLNLFTMSFSVYSQASTLPCGVPQYSQFVPTKHIEYLRKIVYYIPNDASVLAQNNIFPHLATRINAYTWIDPENSSIVDYAICDITHPDYYMRIPHSNLHFNHLFEKIFYSGKYGIYAAADGIILLKKNYNALPVFVSLINRTYNYQKIDYTNGHLVVEETSISRHSIFLEPFSTWHIHCVALPFGKYTIKIRLKSNSTSSNSISLTLKLKSYFNASKQIIYATGEIQILQEWMYLDISLSIYSADIFCIDGEISAKAPIVLDQILIMQTNIIP